MTALGWGVTLEPDPTKVRTEPIVLKNYSTRNSSRKIGILFSKRALWQTSFAISLFLGMMFRQIDRRRSNAEFFNTISPLFQMLRFAPTSALLAFARRIGLCSQRLKKFELTASLFSIHECFEARTGMLEVDEPKICAWQCVLDCFQHRLA